MVITVEKLKRLKACEAGIRYIERFYPNGAEIIDIIKDRHINKEFLHWGREFLTITDEELIAYCVACDIVNSEGYWYSVKVHDSQYVVKSKDVSNSRSVFESIDITDSTDIVDSENVNLSHQIFHSSMIDTCKKIFKGINIVEGINICNSTMVARSKNVIESKDIFDSSEIIRCNTVTNSHFCQDCTNIEHCMFCNGLENAEYHIFNIPVDKNRYEIIEKQYIKYFTDFLSFIREWPENLASNLSNIPTKKFDDWYSPVSEKFWKWVRSLPGYNGMLLYEITFIPNFLLDS